MGSEPSRFSVLINGEKFIRGHRVWHRNKHAAGVGVGTFGEEGYTKLYETECGLTFDANRVTRAYQDTETCKNCEAALKAVRL